MKRFFAMMIAGISCVTMLAGCGNSASTETAETPAATETAETTEQTEATEVAPAAAENVKVDKLTIGFVPSRDPDEIVTATEPRSSLQQSLQDLAMKLAKLTLQLEPATRQ